MNAYIPILVLGVIAMAFAVVSVVLASVVGPKRYNRAKLEAYECGIEPAPRTAGSGRFPVKFYLTAMLFIIFDIEIVSSTRGRCISIRSACSASRRWAFS